MCVCEHYLTLCVSSAASFSQFATSRSWASTFFGSFCASDVGNDDDGGDGGGGGNLHDEAGCRLDEGFPNGSGRQEDKKTLNCSTHH